MLTSKDWCQDYMVNSFVNTRCSTYWLIITINLIIIIIITTASEVPMTYFPQKPRS